MAMDVQRLIDEVRIRPALWDNKSWDSKSRSLVPNLWMEVANVLAVDNVEQCKRKWKNLRDTYRALVRSSERRIERDKRNGEYDPNTDYDSKWDYFQAVSFIKDNKRRRLRHSNDYDQNTNSTDDDIIVRKLYNVCDMEVEPTRSGDDEIYSVVDDDDDDDDERDVVDDDMLYEFRNIATPPALPIQLPDATILTKISLQQNHPNKPAEKPPTGDTAAATKDCKCSTRSRKHIHFLENLGQEEQKLMQSTQRDIKRTADHAGDSDYNFLVSFLPQLKKMSDLQNLQFRARMSEMVLNILGPSISVYNPPAPPPLTAGPAIAQLQSRVTPALTLFPRPQSSLYQCSGDGRSSEDIIINAATSTSVIFRP